MESVETSLEGRGGNGTGEEKGCGPWRISGQGCCFPVECPVFDPRVRGGEKPIHWMKGGVCLEMGRDELGSWVWKELD